jgi:hypothetical protein
MAHRYPVSPGCSHRCIEDLPYREMRLPATAPPARRRWPRLWFFAVAGSLTSVALGMVLGSQAHRLNDDGPRFATQTVTNHVDEKLPPNKAGLPTSRPEALLEQLSPHPMPTPLPLGKPILREPTAHAANGVLYQDVSNIASSPEDDGADEVFIGPRRSLISTLPINDSENIVLLNRSAKPNLQTLAASSAWRERDDY